MIPLPLIAVAFSYITPFLFFYFSPFSSITFHIHGSIGYSSSRYSLSSFLPLTDSPYSSRSSFSSSIRHVPASILEEFVDSIVKVRKSLGSRQSLTRCQLIVAEILVAEAPPSTPLSRQLRPKAGPLHARTVSEGARLQWSFFARCLRDRKFHSDLDLGLAPSRSRSRTRTRTRTRPGSNPTPDLYLVPLSSSRPRESCSTLFR